MRCVAIDPPGNPDLLTHSLDQLRREYVASLPGKRAVLQGAWRAWCHAPSSASARENFKLRVHRLAGSAGSYGFEDLGRAALELDRLLVESDAATPSPAIRASWQALADELDRASTDSTRL